MSHICELKESITKKKKVHKKRKLYIRNQFITEIFSQCFNKARWDVLS